jgi:hypothetical protein
MRTAFLITALYVTASAATITGLPGLIVDARLQIPEFAGAGSHPINAYDSYDQMVDLVVTDPYVSNGMTGTLYLQFELRGQPDFFVYDYGYRSEDLFGQSTLFVNGQGGEVDSTYGMASWRMPVSFIYGQSLTVHIQATAHVGYSYTTLLAKPAQQKLAGKTLSYYNGSGSYVALTNAFAVKDQGATVAAAVSDVPEPGSLATACLPVILLLVGAYRKDSASTYHRA